MLRKLRLRQKNEFLIKKKRVYDHAFLVKEMKIKIKALLNLCMNKSFQKSPKKKQKLKDRVLKNRTD